MGSYMTGRTFTSILKELYPCVFARGERFVINDRHTYVFNFDYTPFKVFDDQMYCQSQEETIFVWGATCTSDYIERVVRRAGIIQTD